MMQRYGIPSVLFLTMTLASALLPARAQNAADQDQAQTPSWQTQEEPRPARKPRKGAPPTQLTPTPPPPPISPPSRDGQELVWQPLPSRPAPEKAPQIMGAPKVEPSALKPIAAPKEEVSPTSQLFCKNIADAAADARYLNQKAEIERLEQALTQKIALLEEKKAEYQKWLERRDNFIHKTEDNLVALYTKVKPDVAAAQMSEMDEETAAAVLLKLNTRNASAILDQMAAAKAARLVSILVGATRKSDDDRTAEAPPAPPDETPQQPPPPPGTGASAAPPPPPDEKKS